MYVCHSGYLQIILMRCKFTLEGSVITVSVSYSIVLVKRPLLSMNFAGNRLMILTSRYFLLHALHAWRHWSCTLPHVPCMRCGRTQHSGSKLPSA